LASHAPAVLILTGRMDIVERGNANGARTQRTLEQL
jgi:hypothetical protein